MLRRTDFSLYCRHKYQYVNASLQRYKLTLTVTHTAPPPPPPLQVCQRAEVIAQNASPPLAEDVLCLKALLEWFKHDFFKWFKKPNCPTPGRCIAGAGADGAVVM